MVIDSSAVIINPNEGEFRIKKREEVENIKPVEGSGKSDGSELNIDKDKIKEKTAGSRRFNTGDIYNKSGGIDRESDKKIHMKAKTVDLLV